MYAQPHTPSTATLWGDLRAVMHANHLEVDTQARLISELLEAFSDEARPDAERYARGLLTQQRRRREVQRELGSHSSPSIFDVHSRGQVACHVDEELSQAMCDFEVYYDDYYDEYVEEWSPIEDEGWWVEETLYFDILDDYEQSAHRSDDPARDFIDFASRHDVDVTAQLDDDGQPVSIALTWGEWWEDGVIFHLDQEPYQPLNFEPQYGG